MNIVQMMNSMMNPVKRRPMPDITAEDIKKKLMGVTDNQLKNIADQARSMGMNQKQIDEGLNFIKSIR